MTMASKCNGCGDCDECPKGIINGGCSEWVECDECGCTIDGDYFHINDDDICLECAERLYGRNA